MPMTAVKTVCPACPTDVFPVLAETRFDRIGGKEYRIFCCGGCGVFFAEPRDPVGEEWYEKSAPIRHLERRPPPEKDWRYRTFFAAPPPAGKLLDVGCGDGRFLKMAQSRGFTAAGFDFERRMVELARSHGITDVESAEFSEYCRGRGADEFDCITLFDVLEHTPEPAWFLGELRRLLKPGGHIAITLPNAQRPLPWVREEHDYPPHHFTRWTPKAMRSFLERNGFTVVRQEASALKVYYLADHFFFYVLMPGLLSLAKRILFGSASGGTITDLYATDERASQGVRADARPAERGRASQGNMDAAAGGVNGPSTVAPSGLRPRLRAMLADKVVRQRLVNAFKGCCYLFIWPLAAVMTLYHRLRVRECGDCLFTLARLERK